MVTARKSRLWKLLRWTLLVLAALILVAGLVFYLLVRRAWPEVDGRLAVKGLQAPVEIVRVEPGVPHLYAQNTHDLFFAQGYVHAQDRLWQMEFNRVVGQGRVSALFGEGALDIDKAMRILGLAQAAARDWETLSPSTRAILTAYADGVNAYLSTHRGRLPIEFTLLGVEPKPWTPVDSLTWGKLMSLNLSQNHPFEILRAHLIAKLGEPVARRLMAPYPATDPVIVPPGSQGFGARAAPQLPSGMLASLPGFGMLSGKGQAWGSNGWVVAGSRTASGKPLLANDTHLGLQMPSVWYQVGLHGGGYDEAGFSFPGMPFVVIGHNPRIAWGITNLCADVEDLYIEKLDDAAHPKRYQFQGAWRDLVLRSEKIEVKGKPTITLEVRETLHGPIINDAISELKGSPPTAIRWPALGGTRLVDSLAAMNLATDWASFHRALEAWDTPSVNFVYADVDGHIGYQSTARIPIRAAGHQGLVPVPGWDGRSEWQGFIPYEKMPFVLDPPQGFIVTANNKVVGDDYPYFIAYDMADPYRARRITDLLSAGKGFTAESLRTIQADTLGLPDAALRPYLLAAKPASNDRNSRESRALDEVRRWDLRYEPGSAGASVYEVWYWYLIEDILSDELGPDVFKEYRTVGLSQVPSIIDLMGRPDDPLFDDRRTPAVEHRDDIVRRSFGHAMAWLSKRYGDDPAQWTYGKVHSVTFVHAPLGQSGIAPLERLFNSATFPSRGTFFTVDAAMPDFTAPFHVVFGTSQRMIVDFADLEGSTWVNSTGQNAQLWNRHREDQIPKWEAVEAYPMRFGAKAVRDHAESTLTLVPGGAKP